MEKTENNEKKKCLQNQGNANDSSIDLNEKRTTDPPTARKTSVIQADDNKLNRLENKRFGKWREKISRLCQNKAENKDPEPEKSAQEIRKGTVTETSTAGTAASSARRNLLKGRIPLL